MCLPLPKLFQNEMSELLTNQNFEIKTVELSFPAETHHKYVEIVLEST